MNWIESFLHDRTLNVSINGSISQSKEAVSGVPQGSVLGHILFLIYVNDLLDFTQGNEFLFVDDVKLISAKTNFYDLQQDLQYTWDRASAWDLPFSSSAPTRPLTLSDNGICIKLFDSTQNLGITIDSSFKSFTHCALVYNGAGTNLFLIRRSFVTLTPEIFIPIYSA